MPNEFHPGQRWISESEPELGLGTVLRVTNRTVTTIFKATGASREYARNNAPLHRVQFRPGDVIKNREGTSGTVESVNQKDGLLVYRYGGRELSEADLSDTISFDKPEERLLSGQLDPSPVFDLRVKALRHQHERRKSDVRGFLGGRIDLIPHQLYIASEVSRRPAPRVLLADEVGLGKTIEACLILHRLILTGRVQRALILVPESLVHQWFVELLRRFNLWFHIFDEERCQAIEADNPGDNPFLDDQLLLCNIGLFMTNPDRQQQAADAGWDMLVVDEAHHLAWSPGKVSPEYAFIEMLGGKTPGLLLLTATPEQLGMASHFARLRLLDPDRFYDFDEFIRETEQYQAVASTADRILDKAEFTAEDNEAIEQLLDRHGTGRVSFRNTRATIKGFPQRKAHLSALQPDASKHERMDWLVALLREVDPEKVLLICSTQTKVTAIEAALRQRAHLNIGVFHEGLSLIQRDRNAAWFADDRGARILICSEIGSEGRNFQFAHHLVLFDLPLDPELLEQRIGRLDRIGQRSEIHVHVPFVEGTAQQVLTRWYHEGLNAFERSRAGGHQLLEQFGARVHDQVRAGKLAAASRRLDLLIEETRIAAAKLTERLHHGRDRLLELNSYRPNVAEQLVRLIRNEDNDHTLDNFMLSVFDHYSIQVEEIALRTYRLGSAGVFTDTFPGLPAGGFTVTCDRQRALLREDVQFLTWDHPLVSGALDLLLGSEKGNSSFGYWPDQRKTGLYLETIHVLECIAPAHLHVDRFLPPTPIRVLVDHLGNDVTSSLRPEIATSGPGDADGRNLLEQPELREELFPRLLHKAVQIAAEQTQAVITVARNDMTSRLNREIARLEELQKVNRSVRAEEIELLKQQRGELGQHLTDARLRLDSIRLVQRGPR